jgi:hypothetical protein
MIVLRARRAGDRDYRRSPALARQHHVDIPAATPRADKPIAPIEHGDAYP